MGRLLSVAPPAAQATPSMTRFRSHRLEQGWAGACASFAKIQAIHMSWEAQGHYDIEYPSPAFDYWIARRQEHAGKELDAIPLPEDVGSYPRLSLEASRKVGYVPWSEMPYHPSSVHIAPSTEQLQSAFARRGLLYYKIDAEGEARVVRMEIALRMGYPLFVGLQVDAAFMDHTGSGLVEGIDEAELQGGHAVTLLAIESDGHGLADNWWGDDWGFNDGMFRISRWLLGSHHISAVYAVQAAPVP